LKTSVEPLEGSLVKLTVTVPAADVDKAIAQQYAGVAQQVRIPGFRKGKAPRPMIDRYVGRERVLADAQQELIERTYTDAVDAEHLRPIDQPDLGELSGIVEGEDYTYVAEVPVRPELTLTGDWQHMKVTVGPKEVSDADVDLQLKRVADRFASLVPIEERGIQVGDFALISFTGDVDGEAYEGNTVDKFLYETGAGQMPPEFDDAMVGARAGDTVTATFTVPENSSAADFVGKTATFHITVHEVKSKTLPEFDDEFATTAGGFDTMEQMRADVRMRLEATRELEYSRELEHAARLALVEHVEGEVPEPMVRSRRDNMVRDFFSNLEERGISLQDYVQASGVDPEQITKDITEEAESRVRQELALEALFRAEGMEITDEDVDAELEDLATSSEKSAADLREQWEGAGVLEVIKEEVKHRKAADWLLAHVEIVERTPADVTGPAEAAPAKPKKPRKSAKKKED
jgi:trigger factor